MAKWVYMFTEGNATMRNLLGGKGANLAEMTSLGLPVPQGFTVTTEACRYCCVRREQETFASGNEADYRVYKKVSRS